MAGLAERKEKEALLKVQPRLAKLEEAENEELSKNESNSDDEIAEIKEVEDAKEEPRLLDVIEEETKDHKLTPMHLKRCSKC